MDTHCACYLRVSNDSESTWENDPITLLHVPVRNSSRVAVRANHKALESRSPGFTIFPVIHAEGGIADVTSFVNQISTQCCQDCGLVSTGSHRNDLLISDLATQFVLENLSLSHRFFHVIIISGGSYAINPFDLAMYLQRIKIKLHLDDSAASRYSDHIGMGRSRPPT